MKKNLFRTYTTVMLVLALAGIAWAQSTDWQDAYKRFIPEVHRAYLVGLHQGINDAGRHAAQRLGHHQRYDEALEQH